ncbi:MAG TPA: ATP synthase F0 subunit C [Candidatus Ornithoclostridium excrementipullorum]|nr:ATP synthase F0 subunit C [Candidatus Ornithoclostridium excrementipullorum]
MKRSIRIKMISAAVMAVVALAALGITLGLVFAPETGIAAQTDGNTDSEVVDTTPVDETPADSGSNDQTGLIAIAAAIAVGLAAAAGAIGMGIAVAKSNESIARQPEAKNDIRTSMMLGLVFIETAIIYALIIAILLIFVL